MLNNFLKRAAGLALLFLPATVASWGSTPTTVSVTSYGAVADGVTDNAPAFNSALSSGATTVTVPCGTFAVKENISMANSSGVHLYGQGNCSIIRPTTDFASAENVVDVTGATNAQVDHLTFDMQNVASAPSFSVIGGESATGTYGPINVHDLLIFNNNWEAIGIGTFGPNAVLNNLQIRNNTIYMNKCVPGFCGNAIDVGSIGTRNDVTITGNRIVFPYGSNPGSAPGGNGIFCGHGVTSNFTVTYNTIENPAGDAIQVYARPFGTQDLSVSASGYLVSTNIIYNPSRACVSVFGSTSSTVIGNQCFNPAQTGISVTYGINQTSSGTTNVAATGLNLNGNVIAGSGNIQNCLYFNAASSGGSTANTPGGTVTDNVCTGQTGTPVGFDQAINSSQLTLNAWLN